MTVRAPVLGVNLRRNDFVLREAFLIGAERSSALVVAQLTPPPPYLVKPSSGLSS